MTAEEYIKTLEGRFYSPSEALQVACVVRELRKLKSCDGATTGEGWKAWLDHSGFDDADCTFSQYEHWITSYGTGLFCGAVAEQARNFHEGFIRGYAI